MHVFPNVWNQGWGKKEQPDRKDATMIWINYNSDLLASQAEQIVSQIPNKVNTQN